MITVIYCTERERLLINVFNTCTIGQQRALVFKHIIPSLTLLNKNKISFCEINLPNIKILTEEDYFWKISFGKTAYFINPNENLFYPEVTNGGAFLRDNLVNNENLKMNETTETETETMTIFTFPENIIADGKIRILIRQNGHIDPEANPSIIRNMPIYYCLTPVLIPKKGFTSVNEWLDPVKIDSVFYHTSLNNPSGFDKIFNFKDVRNTLPVLVDDEYSKDTQALMDLLLNEL